MNLARTLVIVALFLARPAPGEVALFPAAPSDAPAREMVVYSTLDTRVVRPLIAAFQAGQPGVSVRYEDLLATEIAARVLAETEAGTRATADFVFSSAMDQQMKLANDGLAQPVRLAEGRVWPDWAKWRETAFALTFEPAVLVYHKPSFPAGPPQSRLALIEWARAHAAPRPGSAGQIGTYDIERSAVGYFYLARDEEHFADIWSLLRALGRAGLQTYPTSQDIIDRVAEGQLKLGYNILGSYAAEQARTRPDLGFVLLADFTVVVSRVGLVPRAAAAPDLGAALLDFMMSRDGQRLLATELGLPAVRADARLPGDADPLRAGLEVQLRPVPVSSGLLAYLDQAKRQRMIRRWREALAATE